MPTDYDTANRAQTYQQAYRAGWNDALEALAAAACVGCDHEHWLKRELLRAAAALRRP